MLSVLPCATCARLTVRTDYLTTGGTDMDPNAALTNARHASANFTVGIDTNAPADDLLRFASTLAEHFDALDEWITDGGFLPAAWSR